jgi:uncharacterized protein (DUF2147 family)
MRPPGEPSPALDVVSHMQILGSFFQEFKESFHIRQKEDTMMTRRLMCALMLMVPLIACSPNAREGIVGTWKAGSQVVEIKKDGNMVFTDTLKEQSSTGSYQFVDDTHVKVTYADSSTEELKVSVSSKKLTVTRANGTVFGKYIRLK